MKPHIIATALASAALASGITAFAFGPGIPGASAASEVRVTPGQLQINQRISQAAVRRVNQLRKDFDRHEKAGGDGKQGPPGPVGPQGPAGGTVQAPPKPGVCNVQTFIGTGSAGIGDLSRSCESVIEWSRTANPGGSDFFSIRDDGFEISVSSDAASGSSVEPAGFYPDVEVSAQGGSTWTVTVRPA